MAVPDEPSGLVWAMAKWFAFQSLSSASKHVLLAREISMGDGHRIRWLSGDVELFLHDLPPIAADLRKWAELKALPSFGNRLLVELTVWTIAAHRLLRSRGVAAPEARALVADIGWVVYGRMLRLYSLPFRLLTRDPAKRMRSTIKALLRFPLSATGRPGYEAKVTFTDDGVLTYFTHCPPHSFVRGLAEEAGTDDDLLAFRQSWCRYDWPGADIVAGDGHRDHYERPHTLSHGDPVCDMCWRASPAVGSYGARADA